MGKRKKALLFLLLFIGGCGKTSAPKEEKKTLSSAFFYEAPIIGYTKGRIPCITVELEDKKIVAELDLGCCGYLDVSPTLLDEVKEKTCVQHRITYGIQGKEYWQNIFSIQQLEIGEASFSGNVSLSDGYTKEFNEDAVVFRAEPDFSYLKAEGRVGWFLFEESGLLLDVKHSKIVFCDSLQTAQKHGYFLEPFCTAPLLLDRGILEMKAQTSLGELRCGLDTGSTWNILNRDVDQFSLEAAEECPSFCVGAQDLGSFTFYPLSMQLPIYIEAVLGMDFFSEHLVFLDFQKNQIFICPYR